MLKIFKKLSPQNRRASHKTIQEVISFFGVVGEFVAHKNIPCVVGYSYYFLPLMVSVSAILTHVVRSVRVIFFVNSLLYLLILDKGFPFPVDLFFHFYSGHHIFIQSVYYFGVITGVKPVYYLDFVYFLMGDKFLSPRFWLFIFLLFKASFLFLYQKSFLLQNGGLLCQKKLTLFCSKIFFF